MIIGSCDFIHVFTYIVMWSIPYFNLLIKSVNPRFILFACVCVCAHMCSRDRDRETETQRQRRENELPLEEEEEETWKGEGKILDLFP